MTTEATIEYNIAQRIERNNEYVGALRDFADWLEENMAVVEMPWRITVDAFLYSDDCDPKERLGEIARIIGRGEKFTKYGLFGIQRDFGGDIARVRYEVAANQEETCERKVVGTKIVQREKVKEYETVEEEVEVVEWECPSLLNQ